MIWILCRVCSVVEVIFVDYTMSCFMIVVEVEVMVDCGWKYGFLTLDEFEYVDLRFWDDYFLIVIGCCFEGWIYLMMGSVMVCGFRYGSP